LRTALRLTSPTSRLIRNIVVRSAWTTKRKGPATGAAYSRIARSISSGTGALLDQGQLSGPSPASREGSARRQRRRSQAGLQLRIAKLDLRPRQVCSLSDSLSHEPAALLPWPEFARQPALVAPGQTSRPLISLINFSACRFWTGGLTPRTLQYYSFVHGANACWR